MSSELTSGWTVPLPMARPLARACPECGIPLHPHQSLRCCCGYDPTDDHSGRRALMAGALSLALLAAATQIGSPPVTLAVGLAGGVVALWGLHQARRGHRFGNPRAALLGLLFCTGQLCGLVSTVVVPAVGDPSAIAAAVTKP